MPLSRWINKVLARFGARLVRWPAKVAPPPGIAYPLDAKDDHGLSLEVRKLLNMSAYAKGISSPYNAPEFETGYHTLRVDGHQFVGQRDPQQRLDGLPFDFNGKSVLDIGCNQGGMLLALADRIRKGVGVDVDYRLVNVANRVRDYQDLGNLSFYVFDLERDNLELLRSLFDGNSVDIVFLLAVCMWIKNWRDVIDTIRSISPCLLFESNGTDVQQAEQEAYLRDCYAEVVRLRDSSPDDPGHGLRRLFLCRTESASGAVANAA